MVGQGAWNATCGDCGNLSVDADHRSNSRSHSALSCDADIGQLTVATIAPRRNSVRSSRGSAHAGRVGVGSAGDVMTSGMNVGAGVGGVTAATSLPCASRRRRVVSRDQLMAQAGGRVMDGLDRSIDLLVPRLRLKLQGEAGGAALIETVRGAGYLFDAQPVQGPARGH